MIYSIKILSQNIYLKHFLPQPLPPPGDWLVAPAPLSRLKPKFQCILCPDFVKLAIIKKNKQMAESTMGRAWWIICLSICKMFYLSFNSLYYKVIEGVVRSPHDLHI